MDALHSSVDGRHGFRAGLHRQIGEIDIHRQAGHIPDEEIDNGSAFERETLLVSDQRQDPDE